MKRTATAKWQGGLKQGRGHLNTQSGVFTDQPYNFRMRFEDESGASGTNPEELIAAAHAGCFTMALSGKLEAAGYTIEQLQTDCEIAMDKDATGAYIKTSTLRLYATVPGIDNEDFQRIAHDAKANCPISRLLNCEIKLETELMG
ncbi:OsmC family protein [Cesiribacter andamanensis]|uniref:Peroxiredoxin osmC n=1 Tax=Cesiribacter andamanensis AMV16 TaxID=1279009 RepID=M7MWX6_9BACT|nr:OsmC family protein [Cesiribacter andamanensis]EMR00923.1 Peroxiredoxin osmC [Cesiribacter andamanensis AMV16]